MSPGVADATRSTRGRPSLLLRWGWLVGLFGVAGALSYGLLGLLAIRWGYEYLFILNRIPYDVIFMYPGRVFIAQATPGLKFGLVAGSLLAALLATRRRDLPAPPVALRETLLVGLLAGLGGVLLAAVCQYYSRHHGSLLSPELTFQIGHIHRMHAFAGFEWGAMVSCLAGVAWRGWRKG